jgi:hypothetical protein
MSIAELKVKKEIFVNEKVESIISFMTKKELTEHKVSTCDHYNWDTKLHRDFPAIAEKLREKGLKVTSQVNFGVTDWYITV